MLIRQTSVGSQWQSLSLRLRLLIVPFGPLLLPIASWTPGVWLPGHVYSLLCRIESLLFRIVSPAAPYLTQRRSWAYYLTTAMTPLKCLSIVCAIVSSTRPLNSTSTFAWGRRHRTPQVHFIGEFRRFPWVPSRLRPSLWTGGFSDNSEAHGMESDWICKSL